MSGNHYQRLHCQRLIVSLAIDADEYIKLYQGTARSVLTRSTEGKTVRFPANILQPFVTRDGIKGTFAIEFDASNRFSRIIKLHDEGK